MSPRDKPWPSAALDYATGLHPGLTTIPLRDIATGQVVLATRANDRSRLVRAGAGSAAAGSCDSDPTLDGDELRAVAAVSGGHDRREDLLALLAGQMRLGRQDPRERPRP